MTAIFIGKEYDDPLNCRVSLATTAGLCESETYYLDTGESMPPEEYSRAVARDLHEMVRETSEMVREQLRERSPAWLAFLAVS